MIAAEVVELLIEFDGDLDKLAREILRLRAELEARDEREQFDRAEQDEIDSIS